VNDGELAVALLASGRPSRADVLCQWNDTEVESSHRLARVYDLPARGLVLVVAERRLQGMGVYEAEIVPLDGENQTVYLRCHHGGHVISTQGVRQAMETTRRIRADRFWPHPSAMV
jgi:hypothetical protein